MDREVKRLKQIRIPIVKVRWNSRRGPEFTWVKINSRGIPIAAVAFPTMTIVMTLARHGEGIRGIHEHLQGVPIEEDMCTLRFRMGMAEAENASMHGKIKTMEAIEMVTHSQEKRALRFGKRRKLNPRYVGPFKVLEKVEAVVYKLELSQELRRVHNTFHVSKLKKCYADEPLAVPLDGLHINDKLYFVK
nr:putative reverse transcriptase domain-containing protein [Tanacetum cinerariifolium]